MVIQYDSCSPWFQLAAETVPNDEVDRCLRSLCPKAGASKAVAAGRFSTKKGLKVLHLQGIAVYCNVLPAFRWHKLD